MGKKKHPIKGANSKMAERTGFEPATSCVTGRHSNQLSYRSIFWWALQDLNL